LLIKLIKVLCIALYCLTFAISARAEIYKDFVPNDTLASIKARYPNASFETIKAAWVKENESFVRLTGLGISGTINLKFSTADWLWMDLIKNNQDIIEKNPADDNSKIEELNKTYNDMLNLPIDQKLGLDWLRWVPIQPIPFDRLVNKYGSPEKCDFDAENFQPYCGWSSKGVTANLSDDKKLVYSIEYNFTDVDRGLKVPESDPSSKSETGRKPEIKPSIKAKKKTSI
jgi:hypothetical protein